MDKVPYKNEAFFEESGRVYGFSFLVACLAAIIFSVQKHAYLMGFPPTIGEPLFITGNNPLIVYALYGLCGGFVITLGFKAYKTAGVMGVAGLLLAVFSYHRFYHPVEGVIWFIAYWDIEQLRSINHSTLISGGVYYLLFQISLLLIIRIRPLKSTGAFGTASLEYADNLINEVSTWFNKPTTTGFIVGRHAINKSLLTYKGDKHLLANAPTRSGKGVGLIIPNLLFYPHNIFVIDPKGENCNITWKYRKEHLKQDIIVIDPFRITAYARQYGSKSFNPLDIIGQDDPEAIDFCKELATTIVQDNDNHGADSHWTKSARRLITGLFYYVCKAPEFNNTPAGRANRTIASAYKLLNQSGDDWDFFIETVIADSTLDEEVKSFAYSVSKKEKKELSSIISTAEESLGIFMDSYYLRKSVSKSDFSIDDILTKPTTVYIVLPGNRLKAYAAWLRVVITTILNRAMQTINPIDVSLSGKRTLWLLDEFGNIGKMQSILEGYTLLSGYGFTFWIFVQNISQLKKLYNKEWDTFIDNSGIFQAFNANSLDTAKYLSELSGKTSILTESESENKQTGQIGVARKSGQNKSISEKGRNLLNQDEVRRLDDSEQLIFQPGQNVSKAKKIRFYQDPKFKGKFLSREEIQQAYQDSETAEKQRRAEEKEVKDTFREVFPTPTRIPDTDPPEEELPADIPIPTEENNEPEPPRPPKIFTLAPDDDELADDDLF